MMRLAVAGGGVLGCLVTRELALRFPWATVTLVGDLGTAAEIGLHVPRGGNKATRRMVELSQDFYGWLLSTDPSLPIHPLDAVLVARDLRFIERVYSGRGALTRVAGGSTEAPAGLAEWTLEACHYAHERSLASALVGKLPSRVTCRHDVAVTDAKATADELLLTLSDGEVLRVDSAVLTPGSLADPSAWHGLTTSAELQVEVSLELRVDRVPTPEDRLVVLHDENSFLLPLKREGQWLFRYTGGRHGGWSGESTAGLEATVADEGREVLNAYAPALAAAPARSRVVRRAYVSGDRPVVRLPEGGGRVVFAGLGTGADHGLAPALAARAADLVRR